MQEPYGKGDSDSILTSSFAGLEISSTPSAVCEDRSVKAQSRTTDMHVLEKSDCAVVPVNRPNKGGQLPAEAGEGRAQLEENSFNRACS